MGVRVGVGDRTGGRCGARGGRGGESKRLCLFLEHVVEWFLSMCSCRGLMEDWGSTAGILMIQGEKCATTE